MSNATLIRNVVTHVLVPVLALLDLPGDQTARRQLMAGIGNVESGYRARRQVGGPALGWWQVEPATHDDLCRNWLPYHPALAAITRSLLPARYGGVLIGSAQAMVENDEYAACIGSLVFFRSAAPLPPRDDPVAQCAAWKRGYNTVLGAGAVDPQHVAAFAAAIAA
ncbi:hypothetical protein AA12717_2955 [Gluconacetobacter sacchari DSM 12717]|uniref:Uncharacterized protein n=2 Tax=Gluconacetobacter sacchari TaxID=92759 RepID=A0A7W4NL26_9PROT|nr:hypothetical protein [Gluconacetobacter sacchari]MBB2159746.1 hypothetical protein [Gluconacetobacter sacchari]GBQ28447.1 hypothetical protein AA12717_2955 [Gluconacetobacter sacchari DSM 12717]